MANALGQQGFLDCGEAVNGEPGRIHGFFALLQPVIEIGSGHEGGAFPLGGWRQLALEGELLLKNRQVFVGQPTNVLDPLHLRGVVLHQGFEAVEGAEDFYLSPLVGLQKCLPLGQAVASHPRFGIHQGFHQLLGF